MDTNNGVEAMNKTLKYNYLPRGKNLTLSHLVTVLMEEYLPESFLKYQKENFAMTESYRSYNDFVPDYLRGRPRKVVLHCLSRIQKVAKFKKESITMTTAGTFSVRSPSGKTHMVQFMGDNNMPQCTCKDWVRWHIPCKHFMAIFSHHPQWGWNKLPQSYLENEYLSADSSILSSSSAPISELRCDQDLDHEKNNLKEEEIKADLLPSHVSSQSI